MKLDPKVWGEYGSGTFTLYNGNQLAYTYVGFNHATGWCYRAQPYGEDPEFNVFEVQAALRDNGICHIGEHTAIACKLTGPMRTLELALESARILRTVGHYE